MKKLFKRRFWGYDTKAVEDYIKTMKSDYEEELSRKRERIMELNEFVHDSKAKIKDLTLQLNEYQKKEKYIADVLLKAEEKAQSIQEEGRQKYYEELQKAKEQQDKLQERLDEYKKQVRELQQKGLEIVGNFLSDIKEIEEKEIIEVLDSDEMVAYTEDNGISEEAKEMDSYHVDSLPVHEAYKVRGTNEELEEICRELGFYNEKND